MINDVLNSIPWKKLPRTSTPRLFQNIRQFLLDKKESGETHLGLNIIQREVKKYYSNNQINVDEIKTVVGLLQARGLVFNLKPTPNLDMVFLRPEMINQYASSIIQAARNHPKGIGAVPERDVLTANIPFEDIIRLDRSTEKTVLESTIELLLKHDLCFREMGYLVFPSQINISRPLANKIHPPTEVTYQFSGSIETIYATLVVRLSHTNYFQLEKQWKYSVEFSRGGSTLGFSIRQVEEGTGEIEIYFYPEISEADHIVFIRFITDHLKTKGIDIKERLKFVCSKCGQEIKNDDAILYRLESGKIDIPCQFCGALVIIESGIEEYYSNKPFYIEKHRQLSENARKQTGKEIHDFQVWSRKLYNRPRDEEIRYILHISDIHVQTVNEAYRFLTPLEMDLKKSLKIKRLDYLIISGDIVNHSTPDEYNAAFQMIDRLVKHFGLDSERIVVVPGNHDLN